MHILISNDDGYLARGLRVLADALAEFADGLDLENAPEPEQAIDTEPSTEYFELDPNDLTDDGTESKD